MEEKIITSNTSRAIENLVLSYTGAEYITNAFEGGFNIY